MLLSLLAAGACVEAVGNYRAQNNSVARTQDLYAAEGEIEQAVAQLQDLKLTGEATGATEAQATTAADSAIKEWFNSKHLTFTENQGWNYTVSLTAESGGVKITAELKVTFEVKTEKKIEEDGTEAFTWTVSVTGLSYQLYEIAELPTAPWPLPLTLGSLVQRELAAKPTEGLYGLIKYLQDRQSPLPPLTSSQSPLPKRLRGAFWGPWKGGLRASYQLYEIADGEL